MATNTTKTDGTNAALINTHDETVLQDWAEQFGVSVTELRAAIEKVGNSVTDVEQYLSNQKSKEL